MSEELDTELRCSALDYAIREQKQRLESHEKHGTDMNRLLATADRFYRFLNQPGEASPTTERAQPVSSDERIAIAHTKLMTWIADMRDRAASGSSYVCSDWTVGENCALRVLREMRVGIKPSTAGNTQDAEPEYDAWKYVDDVNQSSAPFMLHLGGHLIRRFTRGIPCPNLQGRRTALPY